VDWWIYFGLPLYFPVYVDLQGGVRRVRSFYRAPQVFLSVLSLRRCARYTIGIRLCDDYKMKISSDIFFWCAV
jgi:hypothetical protein